MAAQELEVDISHGMCLSLRCTIDTRNLTEGEGIYTSEFRYKSGGWKLRCGKGDDTLYFLVLHNWSGVSPNPLHVAAHVESSEDGRIEHVLPCVRRFTDEFESHHTYPIWMREEETILRSVREFRQHGILKMVVVLKAELEGKECPCATCQFTATDDNVPSLESFLKDLGDILDQNDSTDVEFRCADTDGNILTTARAHKFLVCARSPVIAAMLHSDMVEGRTGVATVRDIDADVFEPFLKYLYSGKLDELTADTAMGLYEAGDRFQVKSLTKYCAKWMVRNLTIENSCEVLLLADAHCDEELAEATLTFMANQKVSQVFNGWEDFCRKYPELSDRVLRSSTVFANCSRECNQKANTAVRSGGGSCD